MDHYPFIFIVSHIHIEIIRMKPCIIYASTMFATVPFYEGNPFNSGTNESPYNMAVRNYWKLR